MFKISEWIVPFAPKGDMLEIVLVFFGVMMLGLATAMVVIGIPRILFMVFQKIKTKREIQELMEDMEYENSLLDSEEDA